MSHPSSMSNSDFLSRSIVIYLIFSSSGRNSTRTTFGNETKEENSSIRSSTNGSFTSEICRTSEKISRSALCQKIFPTWKYVHLSFLHSNLISLAPEYESKLFLDCCGLVRRVMYDLAKDFGFVIGPWNQSYMYDTLSTTVTNLSDVKPGDLVFISAIYHNEKSEQVCGKE